MMALSKTPTLRAKVDLVIYDFNLISSGSTEVSRIWKSAMNNGPPNKNRRVSTVVSQQKHNNSPPADVRNPCARTLLSWPRGGIFLDESPGSPKPIFWMVFLKDYCFSKGLLSTNPGKCHFYGLWLPGKVTARTWKWMVGIRSFPFGAFRPFFWCEVLVFFGVNWICWCLTLVHRYRKTKQSHFATC